MSAAPEQAERSEAVANGAGQKPAASPGLQALMLDGLDRGVGEAMARLVLMFEVNKRGQSLQAALDEFTVGIRDIRDIYGPARAAILNNVKD